MINLRIPLSFIEKNIHQTKIANLHLNYRSVFSVYGTTRSLMQGSELTGYSIELQDENIHEFFKNILGIDRILVLSDVRKSLNALSQYQCTILIGDEDRVIAVFDNDNDFVTVRMRHGELNV